MKRKHESRTQAPRPRRSRQMRLILTEPTPASPANEWTLDSATRSRGLEGVAAARRALEGIPDEHWSEAS
ncbi:MAG TPA: hypothetical protein VI916_07130 [Acidimicrobiia bacterium]|nr:hypothetical protein [Acidimicrobiia bacterium]